LGYLRKTCHQGWWDGGPPALLGRRDAQLDRARLTAPPAPEPLPARDGIHDSRSRADQETPNFISLIAAKSEIAPPTRLVA
jgi:hypothetical protein